VCSAYESGFKGVFRNLIVTIGGRQAFTRFRSLSTGVAVHHPHLSFFGPHLIADPFLLGNKKTPLSINCLQELRRASCLGGLLESKGYAQ